MLRGAASVSRSSAAGSEVLRRWYTHLERLDAHADQARDDAGVHVERQPVGRLGRVQEQVARLAAVDLQTKKGGYGGGGRKKFAHASCQAANFALRRTSAAEIHTEYRPSCGTGSTGTRPEGARRREARLSIWLR